MGGAAPRRPGRLHRMDTGRAPSPPTVPGIARRQAGSGSGARELDALTSAGSKARQGKRWAAQFAADPALVQINDVDASLAAPRPSFDGMVPASPPGVVGARGAVASSVPGFGNRAWHWLGRVLRRHRLPPVAAVASHAV